MGEKGLENVFALCASGQQEFFNKTDHFDLWEKLTAMCTWSTVTAKQKRECTFNCGYDKNGAKLRETGKK